MTTAADISPKAVERMVERMEAEMVEYRLCDDLKPLLRALRSALTAEAEHRKRLEAELAEARRG